MILSHLCIVCINNIHQVFEGENLLIHHNIDWSFFLLGREKKKKDLERKAMKVIVRRNFPRIKKFYKNQEAIEAGSFLRINLPLKSSKHPRVKVWKAEKSVEKHNVKQLNLKFRQYYFTLNGKEQALNRVESFVRGISARQRKIIRLLRVNLEDVSK